MNWPSVAFGDAFEIQLGKMLDKQKNVGEMRPYLANRDVQWGKCDTSNLGEMRFTEADRAKFALQEGDLLVCEGGEVGRTAIWDGEVEKCYYQKAIHRLRPKLRIEPRFVLRFMRWAADRNLFARLTSTTSIAHLTKAKLQEIPFPHPPLSEQKRIAGILDATDALRARRREALAQLDTLIHSIFLDMFGDPVTNPMGWEQSPLGKLCDVGSSKRVFVNELVEEGVPFYRGTEVGSLGEGDAVTPTLFITHDHYEQLKRHSGVPCPGDLLLPSICPDGRIFIVRDDKPFYFKDGRVLWIKAGESGINSTFLRYHLKAVFFTNYSKIASGTTFAELKIFALKDLVVHVPPRDEQNRFTKFVEAIEGQKARMRSHLTELDALFASLQFRAFNGEL